MNYDSKNIGEKLLLRFLMGEATPEETVLVEQWLEASYENRRQLDQYEKLWFETGQLKTKPVKVDINAAWIKLDERIDTYEKKASKIRFTSNYKWILPVIATAAVLFFLVIPRWFTDDKSSHPIRFTTALNEVKEDTLSDGSLVLLNENSTLEYPASFAGSDERRIKLKGEAFIKASPDKNKPLIVETEQVWVKVVGTEFSVDARPGKNIEVFVKEGNVLMAKYNSVRHDTLSVLLDAGETGRWLTSTQEFEKIKIPQPTVISWVDSTFFFSDTPLTEVFSLLEMHFNVEIEADKSLIQKCRLTTTFENQKLEEIIEIISATFELNYTKQGNYYKIEGNECS